MYEFIIVRENGRGLKPMGTWIETALVRLLRSKYFLTFVRENGRGLKHVHRSRRQLRWGRHTHRP
jgi:hypothetical protein